ncbi:MAG: NIPSNAP family containing protein [Alphaproteobacteria bacterium]
MSSFFELRIYQILPGQRDAWEKFMQETIIPFQVAQGMVIHGSFMVDSVDQFSVVEGERVMDHDTDMNTYIWIRRFESEEQKAALYKAVYESDEWINNIGPTVATLIDRNSIKVYNMSATALSVMK